MTQFNFNPVKEQVVIAYQLPFALSVSITLYSITGKMIDKIQFGVQQSGAYSLGLDIENKSNRIYLCSIEAGGFKKNKKLLLVK